MFHKMGPMSEWMILDTGPRGAEENMHFDTCLLENVEASPRPVLHFYDWAKESATYGWFTEPSTLLNLDEVQHLSLELARRPTGGGIVFHQWDLAFSVLVPSHCPEFSTNTLDNYAFVNRAVLAAVKEYLDHIPPLSLTVEDAPSWDKDCSRFCMARPTKYDVMWEGKKIAGAAQRKTRKGYLHQGTIALVMPPDNWLDQILLPGTRVKEAMFAHTCPLLGRSASAEQLTGARRRLRELLATHLTQSSLSLQ